MKNNITKRITLITILMLIFVLNININSYAIEKPNYVNWIRDLYDYSDEVTDEEIIKEKGFEDEAGRVFFKNPTTLSYNLFTGNKEIIASIMGFAVGMNNGEYKEIDLSSIVFNENVSNIVYYSQRKFGNVMYGKTATIKEAGCGPVSLAMIVDSLTNANMGPVGMCNWAVSHGYRCEGNGTYQSIMTKGAAQFGLISKEISKHDMQALATELSQGHPVIALGTDPKSRLFTSCGHYITLTGITADGTITVNDPNEKATTTTFEYIANYSRRIWAFTTPVMN